ncbi:MAG: LysM peptidoglycan-binding domain-containing protein [Christensenellaceae bacterium]
MQTYILKPRDTLASLSARFGVPVCMIVRANGGIKLAAGAKIKIPPDNFCETCAYRTIKQGETLLDIARECGVTPLAIMRKNGLSPGSGLREGMLIAVPEPPAGVRVYTCRATDTIENLAEREGVSVKVLRELNPGVNQVYAGAQIYLPRNSSVTSSFF